MNRKVSVLFLFVLMVSIASAQNFTTLSAAMTANQDNATVASATYTLLPTNPTGSGSVGAPTGSAFTVLFIDSEAMAIQAAGRSSTNFKVLRGYAGTKAAAHLSAAKVWTGPASLFNVLNPGNTLSRFYRTGIGPLIATATTANLTVAPANPIQHVNGTGSLKTITVPDAFRITGGCLVLIPDAAFTTVTTGNVAVVSTGVANKALTMCWEPVGGKWYPSY